MDRVQLLLEHADFKALKELAAEYQTSMSDVVRELLRARLNEHKRDKMRRAAEMMAEEYNANPELTSLSTAHFAEKPMLTRGEVWLINLDPTIGAEIRKTRPVVIVSSDDVGVLPLKVVAPITEWKAHYADVPWMTAINPNSQNGLEKPSSCDALQVRSVSVERFIRKLGKLDAQTMKTISLALAAVLEIDT